MASLATLAWSLVGAPVVAAADPVVFGSPTATSKFDDGIHFSQPVTVSAPIERVEVLYSAPGDVGPTVEPIADLHPSGQTTLDYHLDLSGGRAVPNTPFTAWWRLTTTDGVVLESPQIRETYADDRFQWKELDGNVVRVRWVQGDDAFGRRALKIGDDAVAATAKLLGVTETKPIDFYIYADQQAFYDALGPATRENVGGQAHADIRTLFALITPDEINDSWVATVVPHELTHVVFQTAVDNPYHDPPHWLNEGLAVYLSAGYQDSDRQQVESAAKGGTIIPFDGLAGAFPTEGSRFFLAYAESVSAVDRIVRVYGRDALVKLIRSYANGVSDDEAFQAALGRDLAGFQADWLTELGAKTPPRVGPRPAPAGPLPAGWSGPQPNPSFDVTGPLPQAPVPGSRGTELDPVARILGPSAGALGIVVLLVLAVTASRRARRRRAAGADGDWNRVFGRRTVEDPDQTGSPVFGPAELTGADASDEDDVEGSGGPSGMAGIHFGPEQDETSTTPLRDDPANDASSDPTVTSSES
jgi:hypothetical protein